MNHMRLKRMAINVLLVLICLLLLFFMYFRFMASYYYDDERVNVKTCRAYAASEHVTLLESLNSLMYKDVKIYACAVKEQEDNLVIVTEDLRVIIESEYKAIQDTMKRLQLEEIGLYQDKIVLVSREIGNVLEIKYYDAVSGELLFSLQEGGRIIDEE